MKNKVQIQLHSSSDSKTDFNQEFLIDLFNDLYTKRINEDEKEIQVLVDKFEIHTKGKEILLENAKA